MASSESDATTPTDNSHPDSGSQLEKTLFGGHILAEIPRVDLFKLAKIRGLLRHHSDGRVQIIGECSDRNLIRVVLGCSSALQMEQGAVRPFAGSSRVPISGTPT